MIWAITNIRTMFLDALNWNQRNCTEQDETIHLYKSRQWVFAKPISRQPHILIFSIAWPLPRFVRASFYINAIPKTEDTRTALASVFSVIRNTSVPFGISTPDQPNISSTRWRTVSDQKDKVYYFESTLYPNVFWIDFKDVDFSEKAPVKKLNLLSGKTYAGNTAKEFVATKPFQFLGIK